MSDPRKLLGHQINPVNKKLEVDVVDEPSIGGANNRYDITGYDSSCNPSAVAADGYATHHSRTSVLFQNGDPSKVGVNGITHEVLLEIVIDRLQGFQRGPFACQDNENALIQLMSARSALNKRTIERTYRGVEGSHEA